MIARVVKQQFVGAEVLDRADEPFGEVRQVFLDESEHPVWASVRVPLLGSDVIVPLDRAAWDERSLHLGLTSVQALGAYSTPCVREPRTDAGVLPIDDGEVCYSVRDDIEDLPVTGEAMKEAEESASTSVSGHMLPPAADEVSPRS